MIRHPAAIAFFAAEDDVTNTRNRQNITMGERAILVEKLQRVARVAFEAYVDCAVRK